MTDTQILEGRWKSLACGTRLSAFSLCATPAAGLSVLTPDDTAKNARRSADPAGQRPCFRLSASYPRLPAQPGPMNGLERQVQNLVENARGRPRRLPRLGGLLRITKRLNRKQIR